ncbi:MAG: hypothetical protein KF699_10085 [Phycisphaeraceae bacterium]|nr:hypothetical protein [Phycisphaeraceae bacterium]
MPPITSRRALLDEMDVEYARLMDLVDRVPRSLWRSSRVNSGGWSLKDVLAHMRSSGLQTVKSARSGGAHCIGAVWCDEHT